MLNYNGFSSNERAKVGKMQLDAIRSGNFPAPQVCELCQQSSGQLQLHNEDYSKPFEGAHPICRSCHLALHVRFTKPDRWRKRMELIRELRNHTTAEPKFWWEELSFSPININRRIT